MTRVEEPPIGEALLTSSEYVRKQAEFLLNDEIAFAASLRATRASISSLLVIVLGLGLFKMDLFGSGTERQRIFTWALIVVKILVPVGVLCLLAGLWWLHSERAVIKGGGSELTKPSPHQKGESRASLAVLHVRDDIRRRLERASPEQCARACTLLLGIAYERLASANRRVRYRIEIGKVWIFAGIVAFFTAFSVYMIGMKVEVSRDDRISPSQREEQPGARPRSGAGDRGP